MNTRKRRLRPAAPSWAQRGQFQQLESRRLLCATSLCEAGDFTDPSDDLPTIVEWSSGDARLRLDVNGDGTVSPVDSLIVINSLNRGNRVEASAFGGGYVEAFDVDGDGLSSPRDALQILNYLSLLAEGEDDRTTSLPSSTIAHPGDTIQIPISISDSGGVFSFDLTVEFDPQMLTYQATALGNLTAGWETQESLVDGKLSIVGFSQSPLPEGAGDILSLTFDVSDTALGITTVDLEGELNEDQISTVMQDGVVAIGTHHLNAPDLSTWIGGQVVVPISLDNTAGFVALDFKLDFDASQLELNSIALGPVLSPPGEPENAWSFAQNVDNTEGWVRVSAFGTTAPGASSGDVLILTFDVTADSVGTALLDIDEAETKLNEGLISAVTSDGVISISERPPNKQELVIRKVGATGNGSVASLPPSEEWIDEWNEIVAEVYLSTGPADQVSSGQFTVNFNPAIFRAVGIDPGPDFTGVATIDNAAGTAAFSASTTRSDLGNGDFLLLGQVRLNPAPGNGVRHDGLGQYITALDEPVATLSDGGAEIINVGSIVATAGDAPTTELWPVMYDKPESGTIDFAEITFFAANFLRDVSSSPQVYGSDFNRDGVVNFADLDLFARNFLFIASDSGELQYDESFPDDWR